MKRVLDVPVEKVMTLNPAAIGGDAPLEEAAGVMVEGGFRHLPVVDEEHRVIGIVSERDLREKLGVDVERFPEADRNMLDERVEAIMRPDPVTVTAATPLRDVMEIMDDERIGAVAVTDGDERLAGVVSYVDVLLFLREQDPPMPAPRGARAARRPTPRSKPAAGRGAGRTGGRAAKPAKRRTGGRRAPRR